MIQPQVYSENLRMPPAKARWYFERFITSGAVVGPNGLITIPIDYDLHLSAISFVALAGAAQTCSFVEAFHARDATLNPPVQIATRTFETPILTTRISFYPVGLVIPGGSLIYYRGLFNAGAAANQIECSLAGVLLPRLEVLL